MRSRVRARVVVGAAVVVAVGAAGGVAWARTSGGSPGYRTAAATRGSVTATLDLTGTIAPQQAVTVGFAQGGTVATVGVAVGDQVSAGQPLAQLDLTALQARLSQAQATQAAAQQTLTAAQDAQTVTSDPPAPSGAVSSAQQAVLSAQQAVDDALATGQKNLAAATAACPAPSGSTSGRGSGSSGTDPQACLDAESAALAAQHDLAAKQTALGSALSALSKALDQPAQGASTSGSGSRSGPSSGGTAPSGSAAPVSAAQLAADQAAVDADAAAVTLAQQELAQGTITSPLGGTVAAVGLAPGQSVGAASSSAVIEVVAPGGYQLVTTVPTADVGEVAVGQHATVLPDGTAAPLRATVTSVAPAPSGDGYPVTLAFGSPATGLHAGASASVALTTGSAAGTLVVPTSAVRTAGSRHVVAVLSGGSPVVTPVTTGTVGPVYTQVLSGLRAGQQVVLADLSSTVTSDSATGAGAARFALVSRGGGGAVRRGGS